MSICSNTRKLAVLFACLCVASLFAQGQTSAPPPLKIVGVYPPPGTALNDAVVFYFDAPLAPFDPAGGAPCTIADVAEFPSRVAENFLEISIPESDQQVYHVGLSTNLRGQGGQTLPSDLKEFVFTRFQFKPGTPVSEKRSDQGTILTMDFPAEVQAEAVAGFIKATNASGQPIAISITQGTNNKTLHVILPLDATRPVGLSVGAGLPAATDGLRTLETVTFSVSEPSPLSVESASWGERREDGRNIVLKLSSAVALSDLPTHVLITNETTGESVSYVPDEVPHLPPYRLKAVFDRGVAAKFRVEVRAGLKSSAGFELPEDYSTVLDFSPEAPENTTGEVNVSAAKKVPLEITGTEWRDWEARKGLLLLLNLSAPVLVGELEKHLQLEPAVQNLRIEADGDNTYNISGDWNSNRTYIIRLTPGLKGTKSLELDKTVERTLVTETVPNYVGFPSDDKYYFPQQHGAELALQSRNCKNAEVVIYRYFPDNLPGLLRSSYDSETENLKYSGDDLGEEITRTTVPIAATPDRLCATPINVTQLLAGRPRGVFCVQATSKFTRLNQYQGGEEQEETVQGTQLMVYTDIGLLVHWLDDGLLLYAHDLTTLAPLPMASVTVYSSKNQPLCKANTGEDGFLRIGPFEKRLGVPALVIVDTGKDFTFLDLTAREDGIKALDVATEPYNKDGYEAFVYADRELYRPGETAHLRWLVRQHYGDAATAMPLLLSIKRPNGKELLSQPIQVSAAGSGSFDLNTQKAYPTGKYRAEIQIPGSNRVIGSYPFSLEEFVPNRMEAKAAIDVASVIPGQERRIEVSANHLTGPPAAQRRSQAEVILRDKPYEFPQWKGYLFGNDTNKKKRSIPLGEQRTDAQGRSSFKFSYTPEPEDTAPRPAVAVGHVFELGGRAVHAGVDCVLFPNDLCLGLNTQYDKASRQMTVNAAAVKADGTPAALATVQVSLERREWNYHVRRYQSHNEARWADSFVELSSTDVPLTEGRGALQLPMPDYGYYRIRIHSPETTQYSTSTFYAYGYGCDMVSGEQAALVKVTPLKDRYNPGEMAELRIESPFNGKAVVVLQGDAFYEAGTTEVKDGNGTYRFRAQDAMFPNVWAEVSIIHEIPQGGAPAYPYSSFGIAPVRVDRPDRQLKVALENVPPSVLPETNVTLGIAVTNPDGSPATGEVTLAAVDDGIHGITNYQNPDPYAWLSRLRKPEFRRAHYYDRVAYDFDKAAPGGSDPLAGLRLGRPDNIWIKTVSLWQGVVPLDAAGKAAVQIAIPAFSGRLRLVAVANSDKALGVAAGAMTVRRNVEMATSMPRFLLPGDTAQCRATLSNYTEQACVAKVSWKMDGALVNGVGEATVNVPPNGEAHCSAPIAASAGTGQGTLTWFAQIQSPDGAPIDQFEESDPLPVRPPTGLKSATITARINPGESRKFENTDYIEDILTRAQISVSAMPNIRLMKAFRYLIGYPYGCVEQTTSRLMPMFLLRENADFAQGLDKISAPLPTYIQSGIDRLFSMQTADGGLAMWPGGDQSYPYASIYALHFLTLANQSKAFAIPAGSFKSLQSYVRKLMEEDPKARPNTGYYPSAAQSFLFQRAYALFVLALDGDLSAIQQVGRFDTLEVPREARYLLAATLAMNTQDTDRITKYLASAPTVEYLDRENYATLNSEIRNTAIELLALEYMKGDFNERLSRAQKLLAFLEGQNPGTTQENAFIMTALLRFFENQPKNMGIASMSVDTPDGPHTAQGKEIYRGMHQGTGGVFTVKNTGQVEIFAEWFSAGLSKVPATTAVHQGLGIERFVRTEAGPKVEGLAFDQGTAYLIDARIVCDNPVRNLVVTDLLPPGFEVENPRLTPELLPSVECTRPVKPSFLEIRDDRVITAYDQLGKGEHHFYYIVRAVTPGKYQYPGILAECMYDSTVRGESLAQVIDVKEIQ